MSKQQPLQRGCLCGMIRLFLFTLLANIAGLHDLAAQKKADPVVFSTKAGAIRGYDPVAYFTDHKPVKGLDSLQTNWNGAVWHFASAENREKFKNAPEKYAPQYGGYCAYGWAKGYAVKTEADAWAIENGKLYLNYDLKVQRDWDKNRSGYILQADANYAKKQ